ncbi:MAG: hypothetical protein IT581_13545 [Verrucomicrobiales bacterium]|nr:hypothetical protein [Verrucomicrobiales bacterium]
MDASLMIGPVIALWLVSFVASIAAVLWSRFSTRLLLIAPMALSFLALGASYFGLRFLTFSASQTVNGQVQWSLNSKSFFLTTLVLGALALARTVWKNWRPVIEPRGI